MISLVDYFKVGNADEIEEMGWVKVNILGRDIVVLSSNSEFIAIELGRPDSPMPKTYLPDEPKFSASGTKSLIERFLIGPAGNI